MYNKPINSKICKTSGYEYFIDRKHPLSNKSGKVYMHRHIMSIHLNKWIDKSYHVHHKDGVRSNNNINNLELISPRSHGLKHAKELGKNIRRTLICPYCEKRFISKELRQYCSHSCHSSFRQKQLSKKIPKELLEKLIKEKSMVAIGKDFNCSDKSIRKLKIKYQL